jgi:hypothetical protein
MSRLITCSVSPMAWLWVSSLSTGVKYPATTTPLFPTHGGLRPTLACRLCFSSGFFSQSSMWAPLSFSSSSHLIYCSQYKNIWHSAYLPLVSSGAFDNAGNPYNLSRIINKDGTFNLQAYQAYSPLFISASFAITYGLAFASTTATATHVLLYYHEHIRTYARRSLSVQPDIHARLMSVYKEVPDWWYLVLFC